MYNNKARARHGLRRLLCCHGQCGLCCGQQPAWALGSFSLGKRLLLAAFTRGEETLKEIGISVLVLHQQDALKLLCFP